MKYSAAQREDYVHTFGVTEITAHSLLRHCTTRWLSSHKVLVRIIEQYENLKEYFLKTFQDCQDFVERMVLNKLSAIKESNQTLTILKP